MALGGILGGLAGNLLGGLFGQPGQGAYDQWQGDLAGIQNYIMQYLKQLNPAIMAQLANYNQITPFINQANTGLAQSATPGARAANVQNQREQDMAMAKSAGKGNLQALGQGGYGIGAKQGAGVNTNNSGIRAGNDYAATAWSPQTLQAAAGAAGGAGGQALQGLNAFSGLAGLGMNSRAPQNYVPAAGTQNPIGQLLGMIPGLGGGTGSQAATGIAGGMF